MKRFLAWSLCVLMILSLPACGKDKKKEETAAAPEPTAESELTAEPEPTAE